MVELLSYNFLRWTTVSAKQTTCSSDLKAKSLFLFHCIIKTSLFMVKELEIKYLLKGLTSPNLRRSVFTIES